MLKRDVGAELDVTVTAPTTLEFQICSCPASRNTAHRDAGIPAQRKTGQPWPRSSAITAPAFIASMPARGRSPPRIGPPSRAAPNRRPYTTSTSRPICGPAATPRPTSSTASATEFGQYANSAALLEKVSCWRVGMRLSCVPGSSDPIDGAADTLLAGAGVCRDYASGDCGAARGERAGATWSRSMRRAATRWTFTPSPRRSSTAPGRSSTRHAWRPAKPWCGSPPARRADTAFLDNHNGAITLNNMEVTAVVDGAATRLCARSGRPELTGSSLRQAPAPVAP